MNTPTMSIEDLATERINRNFPMTFAKYNLFHSLSKKEEHKTRTYNTSQDAFIVYFHYMYTGMMQNTNQPWANDSYMIKGLGWAKERFYKAKKLLKSVELVEPLPVLQRANGTKEKPYMKIITSFPLSSIQQKESEKESASVRLTSVRLSQYPFEPVGGSNDHKCLREEYKCLREKEDKCLREKQNASVPSGLDCNAPSGLGCFHPNPNPLELLKKEKIPEKNSGGEDIQNKLNKVEENVVIEINEHFKEFCQETFGKEEGTVVCSFYNNFFDTKKFRKEGAAKHLSKDDKIKNISNILKLKNKDLFLECIKKFQKDWDNGTVTTHSIKYFTAVAERFELKKSSKEYYKKDEIKSQISKTIVPTKYKKVREGLGMEFLNWDYTCECGNIIDPWKTSCPFCESSLDWSNA